MTPPTHFVRKPTTVEAVQWHTGDEPVYDLRGNLIATEDGEYVSRDTMTGEVEVFSQDWFETVYEPTDSPLTPPNADVPPSQSSSGTVVPPAPPAAPVPQTPVTDISSAASPPVPPTPTDPGETAPPATEPPSSPATGTTVIPGQR